MAKNTLDRKDLLSAVCYEGKHERCTGRIVNPVGRAGSSRSEEMDCMCACHVGGNNG